MHFVLGTNGTPYRDQLLLEGFFLFDHGFDLDVSI